MIFIGSPHVPSSADEATFCDIHLVSSVASVCQPLVVPSPVGKSGFSMLSWYVMNTLNPSAPSAPSSPLSTKPYEVALILLVLTFTELTFTIIKQSNPLVELLTFTNALSPS